MDLVTTYEWATSGADVAAYHRTDYLTEQGMTPDLHSTLSFQSLYRSHLICICTSEHINTDQYKMFSPCHLNNNNKKKVNKPYSQIATLIE